MGLVNYFNCYIENFATFAALLYDRTRGLSWSTRIELSSDELEPLSALKKAFVSPPLLAHPRFDEPFILQTNGSRVAIGAVLLQMQPNSSEIQLGYYSNKLTRPEKNYSAYKLEYFAEVKSIKHLRVYLLAREFTVRTDNRALKWLHERKTDESILGRKIADLQEKTSKIENLKGLKNQAENALSRRDKECKISALAAGENDSDFPVDVMMFQRPILRDWAAVQRADSKLLRIIFALTAQIQPEDDL